MSARDVGSLLALGSIATADGAGNVRSGRGVDIDSHDSIVYSTDRLVATLGISDLIVVDTSDATLVLPKDRAQDVRQVVAALKLIGAPEITQPKVFLRPWGSYTSLLQDEGYHIRLLEIRPGGRQGLQLHEHRSEHWVVVAGTVLVTREAEEIEVGVNESAFIPPGAVHRIENRGAVVAQVLEVGLGESSGEDDIVRFEDGYHRQAE